MGKRLYVEVDTCVPIYYREDTMKKRSWSERDLRDAVVQSKSIRRVLLKLGLRPAGGNYAQIQKYIRLYHLPTSHFTGKAWNRGMRGIGKPRLALKQILQQNSQYQSYKLKRRLFSAKLKEPKCELCGWAQHAPDGRLPLELDHINGKSQDNRLANLRVLCPNCHSLQPTHRGLNQHRKHGGKWRNRYTRDT